MTISHKTIGHLAMWAQALLLFGAAKGARNLGDRQSYLGMSDIGRGVECLRASVSSKLEHSFAVSLHDLRQYQALGNVGKIMDVLKREITLQRGHWVEAGMIQALSSLNLNYLQQLEIKALHKGVPIQAHLDLTLVGSKSPSVRVLELKSTKRLRDRLFASHETQLYAQIGLLKALWNKPAFNLKNADGVLMHHDLTFPEMAGRVFGVTMPENAGAVDIEGWVVSVAPDDARLYGPYAPHDDTIKVCLNIAEQIWTAVTAIRAGTMSIDDVPYNEGFHPLCDWCDHNGSCPKFQGQAIIQFADLLLRRASVKERIQMLKEDNDELDEALKAAYHRLVSTGRVRRGDWVISGDMRFRVLTIRDGTERLYVGTVNDGRAASEASDYAISAEAAHGKAA